ncbi:hypothetical protein F5B19DRAFT_476076 [Rostrohypoxylon terebratum]|nr:hypothetical protein F5B19DRAFT_476076 [Rostrohypoxylon terebratum]
MADHHGDAPASPAAPSPVYQLPEWETITHPPKPRQSFLGRILPTKGHSEEHQMATSNQLSTEIESNRVKERSDQAFALPMRTPSNLNTENSSAKPTLATSLRACFNSAFPPHKTYFGRPRRFLFLYIVLPVAIFFAVLVPLGVGLGVGLSRRFGRVR